MKRSDLTQQQREMYDVIISKMLDDPDVTSMWVYFSGDEFWFASHLSLTELRVTYCREDERPHGHEVLFSADVPPETVSAIEQAVEAHHAARQSEVALAHEQHRVTEEEAAMQAAQRALLGTGKKG